MVSIEWNDSLSVGVDLIDEQHKSLITKIKDLSDAVEKHQGTDKIASTLSFMIEYTNFHFSTEEKHMKAHDYPYRKEHMAQHVEFFEMLEKMVDDFKEEGATRALSTSINTFLMNWLVDHINSIDTKFGEFLRETGHTDIKE